MKKFLALAMAAVLLICSFASCAAGMGDTSAIDEYVPEKDYLVDDKGNTFYFEEAEGETAILVKYSGKATRDDKVVIPAMFGDRTVTTIGDNAFYNLAALVEVTIPDTVTVIGKHAFAGCTELTVVNLPAGMISIGEAAFARCEKLTTLNDADHPLNALESIGAKAFWECKVLATINGGKLPATLKEIGEGAFWACESLTSVEFPESVEKIGDLAYYNCTGLESIKLHNNFKAENLGKFIFTTETSTLKDKIDTSNLTEGSDAWNYVQNIAEPAEEETVDPSNPDETEDPDVPDTKEPETQKPEDPETNPPETKPAEPDTYVTHLSFDELRKNGDGAQGVFTPGQAAGWDKIATVDKTYMSMDFWGWVGVIGEVGQFGYQIDNGPIVYDETFAVTAEQGVVEAAAGTGADNASRMLIKIDISKISGESTVKTYYKSVSGKAEVLAEFTVKREAPALTAPAGEAQPVHIISGEALYPPVGANDVAGHTPYEGYVNIIPSSDDPYYLLPAGFTGARYVSIKYCTTTADKCNTQIYLGSTGEGPRNDNTMLQTPIVGDGNWNIVVFDLDQLKEPLNAEYYVSYFRFDVLQAGFQTDENGNYIYINEEAGNIAKLPMPAGADIDVAYVAFFNSYSDAYAYEYGLPKPAIQTTKPEGYDNATDVEFEAQAEAIKDDANIFVNDNGTFGYVYLKAPDGLENAKSIPVKFTVDEDGTYKLLVTMMGWTGTPRTGYVQIDDGVCYYIRSEGNEVAEDGTLPMYVEISEKLTAGEHTFTLYLANDFDNSTVKSLYFDKLSFVNANQRPANMTNVALNQRIESSDSYIPPEGFFHHEQLIDGIWTTYPAGPTLGWNSKTDIAYPQDCNIDIDITLDKAYTIYDIILKPMQWSMGEKTPQDFTLQLSIDGQTWVTVVTEVDMNTAAESDTAVVPVVYNLEEPVDAKYFRMHITRHSNVIDMSGAYNSGIGEIELWGVEAAEQPEDTSVTKGPLSMPKTTFVEGEAVNVIASGSGTDWVGIYEINDEFPAIGSIYWYYVADYAAGEAVNIRGICEVGADQKSNGREGLPAGEYKVILFSNDGYEVIEQINITITAA